MSHESMMINSVASHRGFSELFLKTHCWCNYRVEWDIIGLTFIIITSSKNVLTHLRDFFGDVVRSVLHLWCDDGFLRCGWGVSLLFSPLEVECNKRDLVDGAVLVDVGVRGRAEQAGLHVIEGAWWCGTYKRTTAARIVQYYDIQWIYTN